MKLDVVFLDGSATADELRAAAELPPWLVVVSVGVTRITERWTVARALEALGALPEGTTLPVTFALDVALVHAHYDRLPDELPAVVGWMLRAAHIAVPEDTARWFAAILQHAAGIATALTGTELVEEGTRALLAVQRAALSRSRVVSYEPVPPLALVQDFELTCQWCERFRRALYDGHPNPEGAQEYRASHGHFPGCPNLSLRQQLGHPTAAPAGPPADPPHLCADEAQCPLSARECWERHFTDRHATAAPLTPAPEEEPAP